MSNETTNSYKEETIVDLGTIDLNHPPPSPKERKHHHHARNEEKDALDNRSEKVHERVASLTGTEAFFLKALLVDDKKDSKAENEETVKLLNGASPAKLSDEMLFSVPKQIPDSPPKSTKPIPKPKRRSNHGLWLAHADGVPSKKLISLRGLLNRIHNVNGDTDEPFQRSTSSASGGGAGGCVKGERPPISPASRSNSNNFKQGYALRERCSTAGSTSSTESADDGVLSDEEVRPEQGGEDESSWDSQLDANHREYDAWEVLKDEYASDFGFNYTAPGTNRADDDDVPPDSFQILGTSADDTKSQPHVLSPPLMDALAAFLPEPVLGQNWWLRFSLVRDGANLDTLKRYVRASTYTILAIETPSGEVFGSFTSSPWRTAYGFYGKAPAFVWKMRHSRQTKCSSLFDQAQLESEIDVFMAAEGNHRERVQLCRHDAIGVGGDEDLPTIEDYDTIQDALEAAKNVGFAICLEDDLLRGTTSHCSTFHNPALCGSGSHSQVFDVAGLEVWTLTPCFNVEAAEKLEMTKFFLEEQSTRTIRSSSSNFPDSPQMSNRSSFAGSDYNQEAFYRRVGHDPDSESRRDRWQYLNTMGGGTARDTRGFGATPRFT